MTVAQLRNWAGPMQAPGLFEINDKRGKIGLVHNVGLGGAVVVSLLRRPEFYKDKDGEEDGRTRCAFKICVSGSRSLLMRCFVELVITMRMSAGP